MEGQVDGPAWSGTPPEGVELKFRFSSLPSEAASDVLGIPVSDVRIIPKRSKNPDVNPAIEVPTSIHNSSEMGLE